MPIVTAAGYPTLVAPTTEAAPTPGSNYQQIQASPDAFGAGIGRAQQQLGDTFEKASNQFEAVALDQQRLTNQIAADNSTNYVMNEVQKILHGDPNKPGDVGYYGLKGNDAVNARQPTMKAMDDLITNARGSLTNPRQQLQFDNETRRMRNYWAGQVGTHYDRELNTAAIAGANGRLQSAQYGMASSAANNDENGFSLYVENAMRAAADHAKLQGLEQDSIDAEFTKIRGTATKMWVESLAVKDPAAAKEFLEHNRDALLPHEYPQLERLIKGHADKSVADQFVTGLIRGGATSTAVTRQLGPHSNDAIDEFKKAGWTEAAINGALANGQAEGGFHEIWKSGDNGNSFGHWQFNRRGELPGYLASGGDGTTSSQAKYLIQRMEELHPGFGKIQDAKQAADIMESKFERPAVITGSRYQGSLLGQAPTAGAPDTVVDTPANRRAFEFWKKDVGGLNKNATFEDYSHTVLGVPTKPVADVTTALPTNRIGLPTLTEQWDKIDASSMTQDQKLLAKHEVTQRHNALEAEASRTERLKRESDKANVEAAVNETQRDVYSANPKITPQMLINDHRLDSHPETREHLIRFINDPPGSSVPSHQSNANAMQMIQRMQPNYDGPDPIRDRSQILAEAQKLNRSDYTFVDNQWKQQQQLGGETIRQQRADLLKSVQGKIVGIINDPNINPEGYSRLYRYEHFIQARIDETSKSGGPRMQDLFDPDHKDFLASPGVLKTYGPTTSELIKDSSGHPVDLTKMADPDIIAGYRQGKIPKEIALMELARRIQAGKTQAPAAAPIR